MKKITKDIIVPQDEFEITDGKIFDNEYNALYHELVLKVTTNAESIKTININTLDEYENHNVFYINNEYEFNCIVDFLNVTQGKGLCRMRFNEEEILNGKWPRYDFSGEDWYLFKWKEGYNSRSEYWVESLKEQKKDWDEYVKQFD